MALSEEVLLPELERNKFKDDISNLKSSIFNLRHVQEQKIKSQLAMKESEISSIEKKIFSDK